LPLWSWPRCCCITNITTTTSSISSPKSWLHLLLLLLLLLLRLQPLAKQAAPQLVLLFSAAKLSRHPTP
jgi:hypothetical protein